MTAATVVDATGTSPVPPADPAAARWWRPVLLHGLVVLGCFVLVLVAVWHTQGATPDDALITARYAQNLLDGHGWVFNAHGHPTSDAATGPLYTLVVAAVGVVFPDARHAATLIFLGTTAVSGYLAFLLLHRRGLTLGGVAAAVLLVLNPWLLATRGLETSTFVMVLLLATLLLSLRRLFLAGVVLALSVMVRGDGAVFAAVAFVGAWVGLRRLPWGLVQGAVVAAVPWSLVAWLVIGSPIPNTLDAKAAQGRSGFWGTGHLYVKGITEMPAALGFTAWTVALLALAVPGAVLVLAHPRLRRDLAPYAVGALLLFLVYGFVIGTPPYHWYYAPQVALAVLCAGVSVGVLAQAAAAHVRDVSPGSRSRGGVARVAALTATAAAVAGTGLVGGYAWRDTVQGFGPVHYQQAGEWLRANTPPDATVAATEIGILGWFSQRDLVDYVGLLSAASVREIGRGDVVSWLAREEPDFWVLHSQLWSFEAAAGQPWFALAYRPVTVIGPLTVWQHVRPIAGSRAAEQADVEPAATAAADRMGVLPTDQASRRALSSLLALLAVRPDLQTQFGATGQLDLAGLLTWAAGPGSTSDPAGAALQTHSAVYGTLAPHAVGLFALPRPVS